MLCRPTPATANTAALAGHEPGQTSAQFSQLQLGLSDLCLQLLNACRDTQPEPIRGRCGLWPPEAISGNAQSLLDDEHRSLCRRPIVAIHIEHRLVAIIEDGLELRDGWPFIAEPER